MGTTRSGWIVRNCAAVGRWLRSRSRYISVVLVVSISGLLVWQLARDWHSLPPNFLSEVKYLTLLASLAVLIGSLLLVSLRWGLTLRMMHVPIGWRTSVRIWFLSQAGRYLPGGVWNYVGRLYLGQSEMTKGVILTSMVLETGLRVVSEVSTFLLSIPFWVDTDFLSGRVMLLMIGGACLCLLLLHPALLTRVSKVALLRRVGMGPVDLSQLRYRHILVLLGYNVLTVLLVGWAFYLLVVAFYPMPVQSYPALTGSLAASVVLGFLVPLAPNGWGVREGMLVFLLSHMMPLSVAIVVSAVARVWLGLGEGVWILAMFACRSTRSQDNPKGLLIGKREADIIEGK
jgi:hypothetical protein